MVRSPSTSPPADAAAAASAVPGRLSRLRIRLDARGVDGILISQPESRHYLSGYTAHDLPPRDSAGYLLITARRALLLTDPRTTEEAGQEAPDYEVVTYETGIRAPEKVAEVARGLGVRRLAFESVHLPHAIWRDLLKALGGSDVELADAEGVVDELRQVKDSAELAQLQAAIDVLDRCFAEVAAGIAPGQTERQVAREVQRYLLEHADGCSFPPIVASGPNGSIPHAVPGDRRIEAGEGVTIDIGARVGGYCSDMTRTICLGTPRDPRLAEIHAVVFEAMDRAECGIRPGMTGREADALARAVVERAGYADAFTHSTGHGIGLEVHEPPWLSRVRGDGLLEPSMVFSVEPGIYLPGWGGVRIEDLVVLEDTGVRVLSRSPRGLEIGGEPVPHGQSPH